MAEAGRRGRGCTILGSGDVAIVSASLSDILFQFHLGRWRVGGKIANAKHVSVAESFVNHIHFIIVVMFVPQVPLGALVSDGRLRSGFEEFLWNVGESHGLF